MTGVIHPELWLTYIIHLCSIWIIISCPFSFICKDLYKLLHLLQNSTTCTPSSVFSNCSGLLSDCYTESESLMRRAAWVQKKRQWSGWWELEMIRDPAAQVHTQLL